ncbi:MAG: AMP-binding protein, partial [bacterium]|nr:AMP-binding protein [bacterium]
PLQEGMLFHYLKNPGNEYYFEQLSLEISGNIDTGTFEKAWDYVIATNEMMRAVFRWGKMEKPVQLILKEHKLKPLFREYGIHTGCVDGFDEQGTKEYWVEILKANDRQKTFDLQEVPFRVTLCKLEAKRYEMIISNHHILYNGWSNGIILKEFFRAYEAFAEGGEPIKPAKTNFREYLKWIHNRNTRKQEKFWQNYLSGFDAQSELSLKKKTKGEGVTGTKNYRLALGNERKKRLEQFTGEHKITLATLLYGTWALLLQRYNNTDDVIFGTTVSGRNAGVKGIEEMIGLFINTLPLRIRNLPEARIIDWLHRIENAVQVRQEYEITPLVKIKESSLLKNSETLFDTIIIVENYPLDNKLKEESGSLTVGTHSMTESTHYDLTVTVSLLLGAIDVTFSYAPHLFEEDAIIRISRHFHEVLKGIVENPAMAVSTLELMQEEEKREVLYEFNDTGVDYPKDKTLHHIFEEQAEQTPDRTALTGDWQREDGKQMSCTLTYRELNEKANRLARQLQTEGVTGNSLVGLMPDRTVEMLIGLLAILKAGAAFIPLGPEYPEERTALIVEECNAAMLLAGAQCRPPECASKVLRLNRCCNEDGEEERDAHNLPPVSTPTSLAYVIHTSGTTGKPKGVMIENRALVNFIKGITDIIPFTGSDSILALTTISFDIFGLETILPLNRGARVVLGRKEEQLNASAIATALEKEQITLFQVTPSRLQLIAVNHGAFRKLKPLKALLVGGEAFPETLLQKTREI